MKITVIDCSVSGHRETYYTQFAHSLHQSGNEVTLIAPDNREVSQQIPFRKINFKPLHPLVSHFPLQKKWILLKNEVRRVRNLLRLRKQVKANTPEMVFFPCLDDFMPSFVPPFLMDRIIPYPWSGLLVQAPLRHFPVYQPDLRRAFRAKNCRGIALLNEYARPITGNFHNHIVLFPDFADLTPPDENYTLIQEIQEKAAGRKIVALLGSIHPRKGTDLFVKCCEAMKDENYFFVMAGKSSLSPQQEEEFNTFAKQNSNCLFSFERIPDEASFNALVNIGDLIFAVYRNFDGSSNLLTKAAAFRKPVLVGDGVCMRNRVRTGATGVSIDSDNMEDAIQAIRELCASSNTNHAVYDNYLEFHHIEQLPKHFQQLFNNPTQ